MSVSPFDHPVLSGLLGDEEAAALFTVEAELAGMVAFETALAEAEAAHGLIPAEAARTIATALAGFVPDIAELKRGTARDGVVVPELVRQMREAVGEAGPHLHFGATSQDVIDTSLSLRLVGVLDLLAARLDLVIAGLDGLMARDGALPSMGHTRMQAAIPVTAGRKIASWTAPLKRHRERLKTVRADVAILHFGGAAGTLEKLGDKGDAVGRDMADRLRLDWPDSLRHSERDGIASLASFLSLVTGSLGKLGQDVALMAQTEVGEVKLASGGGSSAMPHKVNPVGAETLVALARFNATLVSGMHQSLVHENERSGAAWTLEWMLLPQMAVAAAASLRTAEALVGSLSFVARG